MTHHYAEREIRRLMKKIEDHDRRIASMVLSGTVIAVENNKVRLELGEMDKRTGKPFLSPFVRVQEEASGALGGVTIKHPLRIGQKMRLFSPSGDIGPHSFAIRDSFSKDAPAPESDNDEYIIEGRDIRIGIKNKRIEIKRGEQVIEMDKNKACIRIHYAGHAVYVQTKDYQQLKWRSKKDGPADYHITIGDVVGGITSSHHINLLTHDPFPEH